MRHAEIHRGGTPQRKHIPLPAALRDYDFLFGRKKYAPETFFKFGVMRDPVDWIQSWYRYRKGNNVAHPVGEDTTFEDFWRDWVAKSEKPKQKRHQKKFFAKADGTLVADYIIPYAELDSHFAIITKGLGIEARLTKQNVSKIEASKTPCPMQFRQKFARTSPKIMRCWNSWTISTNGALNICKPPAQPAPDSRP